MSDNFSGNGLQLATANELLEELTTEMKNIYGEDIVLDSSTPDGQWLNILVQKGVDVRGLISQLYNSFNPDNTQGSLLDQRCAINNIFRKAGTFTTVSVNITTNTTVTLQGLDSNYNSVNGTGYTIQDDAGNRFILANTQTLTAGTTSVLFRAEQMGEVIVLPNTITTPVTIVLGVVSVNNPTVASSVGSDEETDADLKIRRRQSVALGSFGYLNGMQAALLQLDGVTDAKVYENNTNITDANGIPPHSIWVVMEGGDADDIANTIYSKINAGCGMKGNIEYIVTTPSLMTFTAKWDEADVTPLYIKFSIQPTTEGVIFDEAAIKTYIENNLSFRIGEYAETATITQIAQDAIESAGGNGYAVGVLISTDEENWVEYLGSVIATRYAVADIYIDEES